MTTWRRAGMVAAAAVTLLAGSGAASAQLVINEVDYDQPSTDTAEFVEIYNGSGGTVALDTWSIELIDSTGTVDATIDLPAVSLVDGDYYVVCANAATVEGCDLDVAPDTNLLLNTSPAGIRLLETSTVIDSLSYEGDLAGSTEGTGGAGTDSAAVDFVGLSRVPNGTDTGENDDDFARVCITPGAANSAFTTACSDPLTCGDGDVDSPEPCDSGAGNGTTECGCDATCHYPVAATPCGDTATDTDCDAPDSCDGAGVCDDRLADDGDPCGDTATDTACDAADTCDAAGECQDNLAGAGDPCGDTVTDTACDAPDSCDGAGVCEDHLADDGDPCGDTATDTTCDAPDSCDGAGVCDDHLADAGDPCGDPTEDACHDADTCDGSGGCEDNDPADGFPCGNGDFCDGDETCLAGTCTAGVEPCSGDEVCNEDENACLAECGDGDLDDGESCDDGNDQGADGCNVSCEVEDGWECDDGEPSECTEMPDVTEPICGDGELDDGEECDDGNDDRSDGCHRCNVMTGWQCDDGDPSECVALEDDGGCGCNTQGTGPGGLLAPLLALWLLVRRRRAGRQAIPRGSRSGPTCRPA